MNELELYHYGIKGMKWGRRRYQNADGSLTPAGKKRYDRMSPDKLQKTLYKQVRKARSDQSDWSNQWRGDIPIGKHSKAALEKYKKDFQEHRNTDAFKRAEKAWKQLDEQFDKGKIDPDEYDSKFEAVRKSIYRSDLDRSITYTNKGRQYSKAYIDKYGKDLNVAYLKDLGYDERTAKEFTERILKADKKMLG